MRAAVLSGELHVHATPRQLWRRLQVLHQSSLWRVRCLVARRSGEQSRAARAGRRCWAVTACPQAWLLQMHVEGVRRGMPVAAAFLLT